MRMMSFALTTPQILAGTKTVTRRLGWEDLEPDTVLQAIEKGQGLKKGERARRLRKIHVVDVRREPLCEIDQADVIREGFPEMTPEQFVAMFVQHHRCDPEEEVTRIEFEFVDEAQS